MLKCRIREVRKAKGISQSELSRRSGVTRCTINILENGKIQNPSVKNAIKISMVLETPIEELYIFEEE